MFGRDKTFGANLFARAPVPTSYLPANALKQWVLTDTSVRYNAASVSAQYAFMSQRSVYSGPQKVVTLSSSSWYKFARDKYLSDVFICPL